MQHAWDDDRDETEGIMMDEEGAAGDVKEEEEEYEEGWSIIQSRFKVRDHVYIYVCVCIVYVYVLVSIYEMPNPGDISSNQDGRVNRLLF